MATKITKVENFNYKRIVNLNQDCKDRRYLVLDIWENIGEENSRNINDYVPIVLQIDNVSVLAITEDRILFDISGMDDIINPIVRIENKVMGLLKDFLRKTNKRGKFSLCSIIKYDNNNKTVLALNLKNPDYPVSIYDRNKEKASGKILANKNAKFNIAIELMCLQLDMPSGVIVIDTNLRIVSENRMSPKRHIVCDVNSLVETEISTVSNDDIQTIQNNIDSTQTEVFEDSDDEKKKKIFVRSQKTTQDIHQSESNNVQIKQNNIHRQPVRDSNNVNDIFEPPFVKQNKRNTRPNINIERIIKEGKTPFNTPDKKDSRSSEENKMKITKQEVKEANTRQDRVENGENDESSLLQEMNDILGGQKKDTEAFSDDFSLSSESDDGHPINEASDAFTQNAMSENIKEALAKEETENGDNEEENENEETNNTEISEINSDTSDEEDIMNRELFSAKDKVQKIADNESDEYVEISDDEKEDELDEEQDPGSATSDDDADSDVNSILESLKLKRNNARR